MAKLVSKVYGDALFEIAMEQNKLDEYLDEANVICSIIDSNPEFNQVMSHPQITKEEKTQTIETIFKGTVADEIVGLMIMMVDKGHALDMKSVFEYFIACAKEEKNIGVAYVSTPTELSAAQKEQVEKRLLETTKYVSFEMNYNVDADLIGGMVIRIGDRVVDSSVRSKLDQLTRELSKIQLKVGECTP
ncbi:MAG: ATP synthase F1 subunit delta [Lachnospiraceae bacterium]|jgi:F-type H+-transporting ATPase subunit delta|nr:ATP synthase F1 subunit delta [Lachnospiraceae bacterium]MCR5354091.1 ATP synthase F1 subunit delta [Lachnospiraceae bacterium]